MVLFKKTQSPVHIAVITADEPNSGSQTVLRLAGMKGQRAAALQTTGGALMLATVTEINRISKLSSMPVPL